jgi:hypothetical protein
MRQAFCVASSGEEAIASGSARGNGPGSGLTRSLKSHQASITTTIPKS